MVAGMTLTARTKRLSAAACAAALLAAALIWWQTGPGDAAAKPCADFQGSARTGTLYTSCHDPDDEDTTFTVFSVARFEAARTGNALPTPLGAGWSGLFSYDYHGGDDSASASVHLHCSGAMPDLVVSVSRDADNGAYNDPQQRIRLARTATGAARDAAARWKCDAPFGTTIRSVPLPVTEAEYQPVSQTDGTCAGLPSALPKWVATARGTVATASAPYENCVLGDEDGTSMYGLTANYGLYAQQQLAHYRDSHSYQDGDSPGNSPAGSFAGRTGFLWASARCPGNDERSLYLVDADSSHGAAAWADHTFERAALAAFAQRSAARHGCTDLELPSP